MYHSPLDPTRRDLKTLAEMQELLEAGWQHIGNDLWLKDELDKPMRRPEALRTLERRRQVSEEIAAMLERFGCSPEVVTDAREYWRRG